MSRISSLAGREVNRQVLQWTAFLLSVAAVLAVAVAVQAFSEVWRRQFDLTLARRLSLSSYSTSVLEQLQDPLEIDFYYRRGERMRARDLLERIADASSRVHYELIDIDRNPLQAKENGVRRFDRAVLSYDGRESVTPAATEEALVGGIAQILEQRRPVLYFVNDHRERTTRVGHADQFGRAAQFLRGEGYDLLPLSLLQQPDVPQDASAVVLAGPEVDYVEQEIAKLEAYLRGGGSVLVLLDPAELPRLASWIATHGLELADDVVIDQANRVYGSDGTNVLVPYFRDHPSVNALETPAVLGRGRSVGVAGGGDGDDADDVQIVARTARESFAAHGAERTRGGSVEFASETDRAGPIGVIGASIVDTGGRLLVVGDADFASDNFVTLLGNKDLLVTLLGWLTEREATGARVRADTAGLGPLSPVFVSERLATKIFWLAVIVQPGLVLLLGVGVVLRRRRR
ncbi:MAG: GldG family protein [Candidatus Binatia bacterium]|nr:GldG family protein [Candidatus Binatia bacterium]